jgi:alcohol dehydrogenase
MKAFVYRGPGKKALEERPRPEIAAPTDAIVKIAKTTICGTDLHILKEQKQRSRTRTSK